MTCVGAPSLLLPSAGPTRTSIADIEVKFMHACACVGTVRGNGTRVRTLKVDNVATADANAHRVLRCAAPRLRNFSPCSELANRARFIADDETQHGDDAPRIRTTTQCLFVRTVDFKHGEQ